MYGFVVMVQGAHLGCDGKGKAAHYRLTDRHYAGKPPTYDFQNWDGVLFEPKKRKVSDTEIARLNELKRKRKKQNPVRRLLTVCPEPTDIRAESGMAKIWNKCPEPTDIRNGSECPEPTDITSLTISPPNSKPDSEMQAGAEVVPFPRPVWSTPVLTEVFGAERDELLKILAKTPRKYQGDWRLASNASSEHYQANWRS
jgi:hypothetical protein